MKGVSLTGDLRALATNFQFQILSVSRVHSNHLLHAAIVIPIVLLHNVMAIQYDLKCCIIVLLVKINDQ